MPAGRASGQGRAFLSTISIDQTPGPHSSPRCGVLSRAHARPRPIQKAISFITAMVFGLLPPLQAAGAAEAVGARSRQQLAAAERAIPRQPRGLAAPHSEVVTE